MKITIWHNDIILDELEYMDATGTDLHIDPYLRKVGAFPHEQSQAYDFSLGGNVGRSA